jgi:hypothetical protein
LLKSSSCFVLGSFDLLHGLGLFFFKLSFYLRLFCSSSLFLNVKLFFS